MRASSSEKKRRTVSRDCVPVRAQDRRILEYRIKLGLQGVRELDQNLRRFLRGTFESAKTTVVRSIQQMLMMMISKTMETRWIWLRIGHDQTTCLRERKRKVFEGAQLCEEGRGWFRSRIEVAQTGCITKRC